MTKKKWMGSAPTHCDICNYELFETFFDANTRQGAWGILCKICYQNYGVGLGTGLGQQYDLKTLEKIAG